jgi:AcrR family transcriptional regulator
MMMPARSPSRAVDRTVDEIPARERILEAAFSAFTEGGYSDASTLEIATRARVSKRALYALVGNKQEMLVACIAERAKRLEAPVDLPPPADRESLATVLTAFGARLLREVSDPAVIAVFRLAIAEATRAPEVARMLDSVAREAARNALRQILTGARSCGIISGQPAEMVECFAGLLWGNLLVNLLLGVANRPNPREIARRARDATTAFLQLHPQLTN